MTLRARLTGAFLAIVLGPVLIGGIFVAATVNEVNHSRERDHLVSASDSVSAVLDAQCAGLTAAAESAASLATGITGLGGAQAMVTQGRASVVEIEDAEGKTLGVTGSAPPRPWAMCGPAPVGAGGIGDNLAVGGYTGLAAVSPMFSDGGGVVGYVYAVQTLDASFARSLAAMTGVGVTIINASGASSETGEIASRESNAAAQLTGSRVRTTHGRYVMRIDPTVRMPLEIAVSAATTPSRDLFVVVAGVIFFGMLASFGTARTLSRATTKPLSEITEAAGRIANGELDARVPVRHDDEIGHLGAALNRLTRDMQSYSGALVASRDQLRGRLDLIGDTLASTHDLPKILEVMLASAITAVSGQAGVIMLADPADDRLRLECSQGFDEYASALLDPLIVPFGSGLLGAVAASGGAVCGRRSDRNEWAEGEPPCETYLAVALRVAPSGADRSGIRGVLALYNRVGGEDFDESDLAAVKAFASRAAIAVDNVQQHDEAKRLSHTDPLTGLYNYRHLKDLLRREAHRAARFGRSLAVLVMDLDRFKEVNDTYGHAAGDAILVEFARRVGVEIRGVDLAFRYGGEEFVLLLPETDALGGATLAQRLGSAIRDTPIAAPGGHAADSEGVVDVAITVSIGVAVYPDHGTSGAKVLEAADDALYAAKAAGRDAFRVADPPRREQPRPPLAAPGRLIATDVRGDAGLEVGAVLAPVDVAADLRPAKDGRQPGRRRGRSGASTPPPPPRQGRGR